MAAQAKYPYLDGWLGKIDLILQAKDFVIKATKSNISGKKDLIRHLHYGLVMIMQMT